MINSLFGDKIDIHGGGVDLKVPHHENEIAQSKALNENYLAIQKIYDLTSTLTENINEEENEIIYENDNIGIIFKIDEQNILSINIKDNNDNYLLEFDNIK